MVQLGVLFALGSLIRSCLFVVVVVVGCCFALCVAVNFVAVPGCPVSFIAVLIICQVQNQRK